MNIKELILPIIVLIILVALVIYFKRIRNSETFEDVEQSSQLGQKFDMRGYDVNIGGNLFVGFDNKDNSEKQLTLLKDAKMNFQDKMKFVNPGENSIIINGQASKDSPDKKYAKNICLGSFNDALTTDCLNEPNLNLFDYELNGIPKFKDTVGNHVYYNEDQPIVRHNKLCFYDKRNNQTLVENKDKFVDNVPPAEYCIEAKHLDMINGNKAVKYKLYDEVSLGDSSKKNTFKYLSPKNVEYGPIPGFNQTVVRTFYMTQDDKNFLKRILAVTPNCYKHRDGRISPHNSYNSHTPEIAHSSYMLTPVDRPSDDYSHIHDHYDE